MTVKNISSTAMMIVVVVIATTFMSIPVGNIGYLNMGDCAILLAAYFFSPYLMFFIGGIGSALADLALGFSHYAIISLVAKGMEGFLVALIIKKNNNKYFLAYLAGISVMAFCYAGADLLVYQNRGIFVSSLMLNYSQGYVALLVASIILPFIKKRLLRSNNVG